MIPPPPSSTLFPYTTLFRSGQRPGPGDGNGNASDSGGSGGDRNRTGDSPIQRVHCRWNQNRRRDRKSTRLNSSHPSISYAVFCLKKKKKKNRGQEGDDSG